MKFELASLGSKVHAVFATLKLAPPLVSLNRPVERMRIIKLPSTLSLLPTLPYHTASYAGLETQYGNRPGTLILAEYRPKTEISFTF